MLLVEPYIVEVNGKGALVQPVSARGADPERVRLAVPVEGVEADWPVEPDRRVSRIMSVDLQPISPDRAPPASGDSALRFSALSGKAKVTPVTADVRDRALCHE
jgi:hypothetical protein